MIHYYTKKKGEMYFCLIWHECEMKTTQTCKVAADALLKLYDGHRNVVSLGKRSSQVKVL